MGKYGAMFTVFSLLMAVGFIALAGAGLASSKWSTGTGNTKHVHWGPLKRSSPGHSESGIGCSDFDRNDSACQKRKACVGCLAAQIAGGTIVLVATIVAAASTKFQPGARATAVFFVLASAVSAGASLASWVEYDKDQNKGAGLDLKVDVGIAFPILGLLLGVAITIVDVLCIIADKRAEKARYAALEERA